MLVKVFSFQLEAQLGKATVKASYFAERLQSGEHKTRSIFAEIIELEWGDFSNVNQSAAKEPSLYWQLVDVSRVSRLSLLKLSEHEVNHYTVEAHVQQEGDLMEFVYTDYVPPLPLMLIKRD